MRMKDEEQKDAFWTLIGGQVVFKETGEVVGWAGWQPKAPKSAAVRGCKPEEVLGAFGSRLQGADVLALVEGGSDE